VGDGRVGGGCAHPCGEGEGENGGGAGDGDGDGGHDGSEEVGGERQADVK